MACESRELGGLGVKDIRLFNYALLEKWIWRLKTDKSVLWKEILDSKYGGWRSLRNQDKKYKESQRWRDLKKVWNSKINIQLS